MEINLPVSHIHLNHVNITLLENTSHAEHPDQLQVAPKNAKRDIRNHTPKINYSEVLTLLMLTKEQLCKNSIPMDQLKLHFLYMLIFQTTSDEFINILAEKC